MKALALILLFFITNFVQAVELLNIKGLTPELLCDQLLTDGPVLPIGLIDAANPLALTKAKVSLYRGQIDGLSLRVRHLKAQLALPNKDREEKDPRNFLRRWMAPAEENPVTTSLTQQIQFLEENIKDLTRLVNLLESALKIRIDQPSNSATLNSPRARVEYYRALYQWLLVDLNGVWPGEKLLDLDPAPTKEILVSQESLEKLEARIKLASEVINGASTTQGRNLERNFISDAMKSRANNICALVEKNRGSACQVEFGYGLANIAVRRNLTDAEVAECFTQLDGYGMSLRKDGIYDSYIVPLVDLKFSDPQFTPIKIMEKFLEIHKLTNKPQGHPKFTLSDAYVTFLTRVSFEKSVSPQRIAQTFFEIHDLAKPALEKMYEELGQKSDSPYLDDGALVILTKAQLDDIGSADAAPIVQYFVDQYKQGATKRKKFHINDLATSLLVVRALKTRALGQSRLTDTFFAIYGGLKNFGYSEYRVDEEIARLAVIVDTLGVSAPSFLSTIDWANQIANKKLPLEEATTAVGLAFMSAQGNSLRIKAELQKSLKLARFVVQDDHHQLVDEETAQAEQRSRESSSGGGSSYSSSGILGNSIFSVSSSSWTDPFSLSSPLQIYNLVSGGGVDGNLFTPF